MGIWEWGIVKAVSLHRIPSVSANAVYPTTPPPFHRCIHFFEENAR